MSSSTVNEYLQHEIYNLRGLCRKLGADENNISECARRGKKFQPINGLLSELIIGVYMV